MAALVVSSVTAGCSGSGDDDSAPATSLAQIGDDQSYLLRAASPQVSDGGSVLIDTVTIANADGYAAVYSDGGGAPGVPLGVSGLLPHGTTRDLTITLTDPAAVPGTVYVILHLEDDGNDTFGYPTADKPAELGGSIVLTPVQLVAP